MGNPFLGVFFHWLGGLASGSFYVPFRGVRRWSWETAWLVGGVFSWILAPWIFGSLLSNDLPAVVGEAIRTQPSSALWTYIFGALWGFGGLTFGLTMRYLGMSLGMAVALGYCSVFGTLIPPLFTGEFTAKLITPASGNWTLVGIAVCVIGIAIAGYAGVLKERSMSAEAKQQGVREFAFKKGLLIATFSGIMSACFSFGFAAGGPITEISVTGHQTPAHWGGLPVLVFILAGGFTTNFVWCVILNRLNRTGGEYFAARTAKPFPAAVLSEHGATGGATREDPVGSPVSLGRNYFFAGLAGVVWYFQFFFYTIGESMMGDYKFTSWTLHMASIIIFSSLWGIGLKEWKGASRQAMTLLVVALAVLVLSTVIIGYGNYIGQASTAAH